MEKLEQLRDLRKGIKKIVKGTKLVVLVVFGVSIWGCKSKPICNHLGSDLPPFIPKMFCKNRIGTLRSKKTTPAIILGHIRDSEKPVVRSGNLTSDQCKSWILALLSISDSEFERAYE
ncbi:hypothetical protein PHYBLDRAFT_72583 [Phycomyces blakesleeanus NRRL 1555(-)]|uniref:Uncharacterized protein n=1 Tax=Phycomyces blakesleeanus (strain ATCC 8743b / DSM 1359 / FGSC 10004 / NBRC 33097 / NRRL 1555) TaxID=763407 RepID=A0A167J638_PHYB8|nr:hypothetical protein PHYBLDRAFT_72583 [Phycomyces blakesleeanus NRRL 1555(-)]OAD65237.1 hypothetical protein PHYBLDRAFT_72583 [Phycomyces blakesleeanus NRRL 1555(-)]|eukprot:XP_018283277.1 hypothetical protein PHYBLDRAFT_72583 [Phycomyces blakesleeanus NRRL 1555(-)]